MNTEMLIKPVNQTTIDVFLNKGWDTWGRFKISHKNKQVKCYQVAGTHFNKHSINELELQING